MLDFDQYVARHGEHGVQAIVENWERHQGIRHSSVVSLEKRWSAFIGNDRQPFRRSPLQQNLAA